jgi:hypothetical protein
MMPRSEFERRVKKLVERVAEQPEVEAEGYNEV